MQLAYEKEAYRGEAVPAGLDVLDTFAFVALRHIYAQLRRGDITRGQAERDKGRLCYELDKAKRTDDSNRRMAKQSSAMFKNIEGAANAYYRERTLENADKLCAAIYGIKP